MKLERIIQTLIALLLSVFVYVIFDSFHEKLVVVGDSTPDFCITTDSGRTVTPASFGGKLLVLNFWATWCPPCIEELPSLNEFQQRYATAGVVVLGISVDTDEKAYRNFLARAHVSFLTARSLVSACSGRHLVWCVPVSPCRISSRRGRGPSVRPL